MHRLLRPLSLTIAVLATTPALSATASSGLSATSGLAATSAPASVAAPGPSVVAARTPASLGGVAPFPRDGAVSSGSWAWPVAAPHPVVRPFVAPATPYAAGHRGIDIRSAGSAVFAPAAGIVSFAGVVVDRPVLSIRHPGGIVSSYEPVETTLSAGDAVSRGQPVGTLLPGHCVSSCLHFGVRVGGLYVSPLAFLGGIPWSILLPTR